MVPELVDPSLLPKEYQSLDLGGSLLKSLSTLSTTTNVMTRQVRVEANIDADFTTKFVEATEALLVRDTEELSAKAKEHEKVHIAKLGRLIEAMNAYHAAHGHYAPAAVVGPD